jgi:hypothetical protein
MKPQEKYFLAKISDSLKEQFDEVKEAIVSASDWHEDELTDQIKNIDIAFELDANTDFCAYAVYRTRHISINLAKASWDMRTSIIHEFAHHICDIYEKGKKHFVGSRANGAHSLEFAIITYCLQFKILRDKQKHNKCFFRSYDFHEDIAYSMLGVSPAKFDAFIRSIEFYSITELVEKAEKLAKKIRARHLI